MNEKHYTTYSQPKSSIRAQVIGGSKRRGLNPVWFVISKFLNYTLAMMAYNCPFNSWRVSFHRWRGVKIGKNVTIGFHVTLDYSYPSYITIEDNVTLSGENYVLTHSIPKNHWKNILPAYVSQVIIKEGSWITLGVKILPGVTVGSYSVISAWSVVNTDIPSNVIAGGVPAKIIKKIDLVDRA